MGDGHPMMLGITNIPMKGNDSGEARVENRNEKFKNTY